MEKSCLDCHGNGKNKIAPWENPKGLLKNPLAIDELPSDQSLPCGCIIRKLTILYLYYNQHLTKRQYIFSKKVDKMENNIMNYPYSDHCKKMTKRIYLGRT